MSERHVKHSATALVCSSCKGLHWRAGQRHCAECHASAQSGYRAKQKRQLAAARELMPILFGGRGDA